MALRVILCVLAIYRVTRLLTHDAFPPIDRLRFLIGRHFGHDSWQAYLMTCPWCMSVWLGGVIVLATDRWTKGGLVAPVLVWAVGSAAAGYLSALEPD